MGRAGVLPRRGFGEKQGPSRTVSVTALRACSACQALGRFPWLAPPFLRSRRLRARFDMGFS